MIDWHLEEDRKTLKIRRDMPMEKQGNIRISFQDDARTTARIK